MFCVISFWYILVLNRAVFFTGEKKRSAFLDFMIESSENGVVLTEEEIKEQVDTIMFEVSFLRTFTLSYLYLNFAMFLRSIRL